MSDGTNEQNPDNIQVGDIVFLKTDLLTEMVVDGIGYYVEGLGARCVWLVHGEPKEFKYTLTSLKKKAAHPVNPNRTSVSKSPGTGVSKSPGTQEAR